MGPAAESIAVGGLESRRLAGALEAAVLFAAGRVGAARACLDDLLQADISNPRAWTQLFDLHRLLGEREPFETLQASYREIFPQAPVPSWTSAPIPAGPAVIALCGTIARPSDLHALQMPHRLRIVAIDLGRLERLDLMVAPAFCAALHRAVAMGKRVILANVCEMHELLLREMGLPSQTTVLMQRAGAAAEETIESAAMAA